MHGVQTLDDGQALLDTLGRTRGRRAVVVGAGYIGVEMAEALINRGFEVTVVNRGTEPMSTLDPDMGRLVHRAMEGLGITMVNDAEVTKVLTGEDGRVRAVATEDAEYPADVVILGIGVRPGRRSPARPGCRWAPTAVCSPTWRCGCAGTRTSGRAATAWRC